MSSPFPNSFYLSIAPQLAQDHIPTSPVHSGILCSLSFLPYICCHNYCEFIGAASILCDFNQKSSLPHVRKEANSCIFFLLLYLFVPMFRPLTTISSKLYHALQRNKHRIIIIGKNGSHNYITYFLSHCTLF